MEITKSRLWAEINLDILADNLSEIKKHVSNDARIMAVVKADAYGHGVLNVVKHLSKCGVDYLAVAMVDEGIQLRKHGVNLPILVLGYTDECRLEDIINFDITQTVYDIEYATAISNTAVSLQKRAKIHIKIDTGLNRIGFVTDNSSCVTNEIVDKIEHIYHLPMICVEGIFSHFAVADEVTPSNKEFTASQFEKFSKVCEEASKRGIMIPIKHMANSGAILNYPEYHLDMTRPGIILYGLYPDGSEVDASSHHSSGVDLKPAMEIKAHVTMVKRIEAGSPISYGRTFVTEHETVLATVPVGYADGYLRAFAGKAHVLIKGQSFPVVGRICMDQCMVDVTASKTSIQVNDVVTIIGHDGDSVISANDLASWQDSINYEVVCLIGKRVPRVYLENKEVVGITENLV